LAINYRDNRFNGVLFVIFAAIALLLASIGLYAVIAHAVSQRSQEIGIRAAMGATARDILTLVFTQGLLPVGIGLTVGLVAALALTPLLKAQLVGVSPADNLTLFVASATLVVSATLGCLIPARRATRVDPVVALRHE
jgi:ABC-type antimicrobial peptide transport system permease subunit